MAKGTTIRMWRRSIITLILLIVFGFGTGIVRLAQLQLVQGEHLQQMALDQQLKDTTISAQRGTIFDRNMKPLAQSATVWTVVLEPAYLSTDEIREKISSGLSEILEIPKDELFQKAKKKSYYVVVKRKIESDIKDKIVEFLKDNKIKSGVRLVEDYKRYYPYGDFASAVLGFTGTDNQGLAGIESSYNSYLTGENGKLVIAKNAVGTDMPFDYEKMIPAKNGNNVVLCIDEVIQHFLEKNLEEGIKNNKVINRAAAIMMDVNTGGILGMAVKGGFDLNKPFEIMDKVERDRVAALSDEERPKAKAEALERQWRNKAVSDTYMPGSVFKIITTSMGFEENLITEQSPFNCSGSLVPFKGARPIRCHKRGGHGAQVFERAFCNSCNPAFIIVGQTLGAQKFYQYYDAFGFTEKTGIDLPGEANGIFFTKDGSMAPMDLAVASFGQNFSITPMQMITAAAAVVNGGYLLKPHVVKQVVDQQGNIVKASERVVRRQVISENTSKRLCSLLQLNAKDGGAKSGYIPGFRIGGKTGTTEKIGQSGPDGLDYISSYCGIAPADNPQVALLVYYDTPKGPSHYGAAVAGPTFREIMEETLMYLSVPRTFTEEEKATMNVAIPFLVGSKTSEAKNKLYEMGFKAVIKGNGPAVISQTPEAGTKMPKGGTIILKTENTAAEKKVTVPNFRGMNLSAANRTCSDLDLKITVKGIYENTSDSTVIRQSIPEGTTVERGSPIVIEFSSAKTEE